MAYHHFCVTLSSLSLSLAFLLHFSPTTFTMAYDLFQDETRQFKPHPRHHRYHSSLSTNRPHHNQGDSQVAYLSILIISIVISLFLIVNCYKKESSPHIPDLTETSCLSAFLSRACYNNKVTGHHSFLLSKVKPTTTNTTTKTTPTTIQHPHHHHHHHHIPSLPLQLPLPTTSSPSLIPSPSFSLSLTSPFDPFMSTINPPTPTVVSTIPITLPPSSCVAQTINSSTVNPPQFNSIISINCHHPSTISL